MTKAALAHATEARRYEEASLWVLRLNAENPPEADVAEWLQWCEQHPLNLRAFELMQQDWHDIVALRHDAAFSTQEVWESRDRSVRRLFAKQWIWRAAAAVTLAAVLAGAALWNLPDRWHRLMTSSDIVASIENKTTSLPDGSLLVLRAQAEVKVDFAVHERRLELKQDGEAYFKVRRDAHRPFIVHAGELVIQAVGTAFDVRHDNDRIRVVVEEGRVRVSTGASQWMVDAGHQFEYSKRGGRIMLGSVESDHILGWRDGEFAYDKVALGEVIEDVNRYSKVRIRIPDERARAVPYTGTVFVRSIDDWLEALSLKYPVRARATASGDITLELAVPDAISAQD